MKHRVFVGLSISEKLQQEILDWEKGFLNLPVRWLKEKNLHITLVPPWYVDSTSSPQEENLERIKNQLQIVAGSGLFEIDFSKVTFGPDPRQPRLIWAAGETPKELLNLRQRIHQVLNREEEKRPFRRVHLTLARFRPETLSSFPIKELNEKVDWRDKADRVVLFESILSREGADYKVISKISLEP